MKKENTYNEFDELISGKSSTNKEIPDEILWKRIQDQLKRNDEKIALRKRYIWVASSIFLVLIIGSLLVVNYSNDKNKVHQIASEKVNTSLAKPNHNKQRQFQTPNQVTKSPQSTENKPKEIVKFSKVRVLKTAKSETKINLLPIHSKTSEVSKSKSLPHFVSIEAITDKLILSKNEQAGVEVDLVYPVNRLKADKPDKPNTENKLILTNLTEFSTNPENKSPIEEKFNTDTMTVVVLKLQAHGTKDSMAVVNKVNEKPRIIKPMLHGWVLGVGVNPVYSYRMLTNESPLGEDLKHYYDRQEKGKILMNYGLSANYNLNNLVSIKTGLQYICTGVDYSDNTLPIPFDLTQDKLMVSTAYGDFNINEEDFEDADENNDPGQDNQLNEADSNVVVLNFSSTQSMKFIQIPIEFEFGIMAQKWRYGLRAGLSYNYLLSARNEFTAEGFKPIITKNVNEFKRNSLSSSLAFVVEYFISPKFSVMAAPHFTYSLSSLSKSPSFKINPFATGLETTLRFHLK